MTTRISAATGNFTTAATWKVASAVTGAELDSEASSINLTNSNSDSGTFTPAATNIDAIAIKISSIITPTGTLTVTLRNNTTPGDAATVTINCSDLPTGAAGWFVFSFTAVVPNGTDSYFVRVSRSVADGASDRITLFASTASATNICREVRLVTTGAPSSGDKLIIAGEYTGAGASTSYTVTMNETATTSYGPTVSGGPPQGITVNSKATLSYGITGGINYYLKMKGVFAVYAGGTFNMGTSGAGAMPSNSSGVLEFDCAVNVDSGLNIQPGGTFNAYGTSKTGNTLLTIPRGGLCSVTNGSASVTGIEGQDFTGLTGTIAIGAAGGASVNYTILSVTDSTHLTLTATYTGTTNNTVSNYAYWVHNGTGKTITVGSTTGWAANDVIGLASTTRTGGDSEKLTVSTVDSATQVTTGGACVSYHGSMGGTCSVTNGSPNVAWVSGQSFTGMAGNIQINGVNYHISSVTNSTNLVLSDNYAGTTDAAALFGYAVTAEVINLTRNVKIRGISTSLQGYVIFQTTSTVACQYAEFYQLGSGTASKRGIDCTTTTGSCSVTYCSIHDFIVTSSIGFAITGSTANNITFSNNSSYGIDFQHFSVATTSGTWTCSNNVFIKSVSTSGGSSMVSLGDVGGVFTNNSVIASPNHALSLGESAAVGTFSGNIVHSNAGITILISGPINSTLLNITAWRQSTSFGIQVVSGNSSNIALTNYFGFGNINANLAFNTNPTGVGGCLITGMVSNSDVAFLTIAGVEFRPFGVPTDIVFENCSFGVATGILTAHTEDILTNINSYPQSKFINTYLSSPIQVASQTLMAPGAYIRAQRIGAVAGSHKNWTRYGTISIDTTIYNVSPSLRLTPNNASNKLASDGNCKDGFGSFRVPVTSGNSVTVSVKVRESVAGDGTAYNGNRARLILRKNVAAGISDDVVLQTATSASNGGNQTGPTWGETLSHISPVVTDNAILNFVVDCDGTTGWINIDNWSIS